MKKELDKFFNPKSIAIIGASEHKGKVGESLMDKISTFKGEVIPINPKHETIAGKKSYASVNEYNGKIDLAVIATPAKTVKKILQDCGKKQIKNIIVISAGFSEIKEKKLEDEIIQIANKYKMNLLGPNCFGVVNSSANLDTTFAKTSPKKGHTAFISQSGALWSYIAETDLELSSFVSLGNMACLSFTDFIKYFQEDKNTKKIVLYVEKLKNGVEFIEICKKSKKPITVIKAGKSKKGSEATVSHTGSLATDYEIYKGAFKQAKIKFIENIFPSLKINAKKIVILTNAGGPGALITDYCNEHNIEVVKSPIDLLGTATSEDYKESLDELKANKSFDTLIAIFTPQTMSNPEKTAEEIVKFSKSKKVFACFLGNQSIKKAEKIFKDNNIDFFKGEKSLKKILN